MPGFVFKKTFSELAKNTVKYTICMDFCEVKNIPSNYINKKMFSTQLFDSVFLARPKSLNQQKSVD